MSESSNNEPDKNKPGQEPVRIGIRELVEFCCRRGDLGYDGGPSPSAQEGIRWHQKIQRRYRKQAKAEVRLQQIFLRDAGSIELGGRIDLLFDQQNPPRLEEIKTVTSLLNRAQEHSEALHWAQLKCYAACYVIEQNLEQVVISLNLVESSSGQEFRQHQTLSAPALQAFLEPLLDRYLDWHRQVESRRQQMIASASKLAFPHPFFRPQQREFAARVYRNIQREGQLLVEAPTGSGKTISTLFPAIKGLGEQLTAQIIFLSAKTSGQQQAINAIELMIGQGLEVRYLVLQAKAKSCVCNDQANALDDDGNCLRTIGFYDRLDPARAALLQRNRLDPETIQQVAKTYRLCPFELSLQMLPWVDIIIADLNYVFDPLVQLSYFKTDGRSKCLLIDEVHNLVDRARSMYSASLSRRQLKQAIESSQHTGIRTTLQRFQRTFDRQISALPQDEFIQPEKGASMGRSVWHCIEKLQVDLSANATISPPVLEIIKALFRYHSIDQLYGPHHRTLATRPLKSRQWQLRCLNAFEYLATAYRLFKHVCGFSATLAPLMHYRQALGFDRDAKAFRLASGFPESHQGVMVGGYIDTRYRQRADSIDAICQSLYQCYLAKPGNYLAFFSSYQFMQQVYERFQQDYGTISSIIQPREASDGERQQFLDHFFSQQQIIGFAILGGVFAEGIDYHGDSLIGAIIVGVGLPQPDTLQKLIEQDFNHLGLNGFDHAFRFPGMTRVLQSAGRVIRSETDRGVIILLEQRFTQRAYLDLFPAHWQPRMCQNPATLEAALQQFWGCHSGPAKA